MINTLDAKAPRRPFFMYWATGAAHSPHHAPKDWIERYRGRFDAGWDKARELVLASAKAKGLVPGGTTLAPRPDGMPAWDRLSVDRKRLYARQMEAFAASLSYADAQFGRILDALQARGELDNTMIIVLSDNGASAEGGPDGLYNEAEVTGGKKSVLAENLAAYDHWGDPRTYPHYSYGWAVAGNTPYRYYKQTTHEGGTCVPLVIAWPQGIDARGESRNQFVHVSDIAPTILDALDVAPAATINDVAQSPMEGESVKATFAASGDPRDGRAQYVEMYGNKGLWWQGWLLVTTHRWRTWDWETTTTFDEPWELYDLVADPAQTRDLAARYPDRVAEMNRMFEDQAKRFHVYPIHNLSDTLADSRVRARNDFERQGGRWRYAGPVGNIPQSLAPPVGTGGFVFTAKLDLSRDDVTGPLFAHGGQLGGIGFYLKEGRPLVLVNALNGKSASVAARESLGAGVTQVKLDFRKGDKSPDETSAYRITISANDRILAEETVQWSIPSFFGISEVFGVGTDEGSPVLAGYAAGTPLSGSISDVVFDFTAAHSTEARQESPMH